MANKVEVVLKQSFKSHFENKAIKANKEQTFKIARKYETGLVLSINEFKYD